MPKVSPIQTRFNAGELSPLVKGRVDIDQWNAGLETCKNYIPSVAGALVRRPGIRYVADVESSGTARRLIPFYFSEDQQYILELGEQYFYVYRNRENISLVSSNTTPWGQAQVPYIGYTQSGDIVFAAHGDVEPQEISRTSNVQFFCNATTFTDGPYLPENLTSTTLSSSGATGTVTVTASSVTGINDSGPYKYGGATAGFKSTDVGRFLRIWDSSGSTWGWGEITGYTSGIEVTVDVKDGSFPTVGTTRWRLGAWSDTTGWPTNVFFYEDRLCYVGAGQTPQRVDMSNSGDYRNFAPSDLDETVTDEHALSFTLNSGKINDIIWAQPHDQGLILGTAGGEWEVRSSDGGALSPTNISARRVSANGTPEDGWKDKAVPFGGQIISVSGNGDRLLAYDYLRVRGRMDGTDLLLLAEHLARPESTSTVDLYDATSLLKVEVTRDPEPRIYALRSDGVVLVGTYSSEHGVFAWGTIEIEDSSIGIVDIAVGGYAYSNRRYEQLWVLTGAVGFAADAIGFMEIEYRDGQPYFPASEDPSPSLRLMDENDAFYVDLGITYEGAATTAITGLDHLEGETVSILADGALHPDKTVSSGSITLDREASVVQVGLAYDSIAKTLPVEAGAADGTSQGKTKRAHSLILRLFETMGLQVGPNESDLETVIFREASDPMSTATPFFTGDKIIPWEDDYDRQGQVVIKQNDPTPGTILAIMPQLNTQDD